MGNLTKNISQHELDCKCGSCNVTIQPHEPVIGMWQGACDHFARLHNVDRVTLVITSAARCYEYNRMPADQGGPGSNDDSQHPRCTAIDGQIWVGDYQIPPSEVGAYFDRQYPTDHGIGVYNTFTHGDTRNYKARW